MRLLYIDGNSRVFVCSDAESNSLLWLNIIVLRAILQESEAKLEMKNFNPSSIFVCRQVTLGDIQKQPYLDRQIIVAMVTALYDVGLETMF